MSYLVVEDPKQKRKYIPKDFAVTDWESLKPFYEDLLNAPIHSAADLEAWLVRNSELEAIVDEDMAWRYIRKSCDTQNPEYKERYKYFIENIMPHLDFYQNALRKKYFDSPFRKELDAEKYKILNWNVEKDLALFREENIEIEQQIAIKGQEYGDLMAGLTVEIDGKTLTLQQAGVFLLENDRAKREEVWRKVAERRIAERDKLDQIYDELLKLRVQAAKNAGYESYTDYRYKALGRFGYNKEDVHRFHDAIEKVARPVCEALMRDRQEKLGVKVLRPWDTSVDPTGGEPLKPFATGEELAEKSIELFGRLDADVRDMVTTMRNLKHFDLSSRIGKEPGGYNYGLSETGIPFIFMNAVGTQSDLTTMMHECGHAVHSFLTRDLELQAFKDLPSEVAELASMSMEMMTMDYWDTFYTNPYDLIRAKRDQITRTITILPWIATVDAFQEWIYDHPEHSRAERNAKFVDLYKRFHGDSVDYSGLETYQETLWHRQLHIFEIPFYYIEYGIAQVGALQVWKNYNENPAKGLQDYYNGLRLGYTRTIAEVYAAAGIEFDFSGKKIADLFQFVRSELDALK